MSLQVPNLAELLDYEAAAGAWLTAHAPAGLDARCKACGVEYLRGELSGDGLCRHCADELGVMSMPPAEGCTIVQLPLADRLPLATIVTLVNGVAGVIIGRSTCDRQRYEVAWFDRHFWRVRRRWMDRAQFEVGELAHGLQASIGAAENAAGGTALSA